MASSVEGPEEVPSNEKEQEKSPDEVIPEKVQKVNDTTTPTSQSQEKTMSIVVHEQTPREADDGASVSSVDRGKLLHAAPQPLQSIKDGRSPAIREKVLEDGYNWRKYGQKLVKGNEFIRSYYKCTHPNCQVKKQLERSHEGRLADIVYFGQHDHPKPQANLPLAVGFVSSAEERSDGPLSPAVKVGKGRPPIDTLNASQMSTLTSSEDVRAVPSESTRKRDEFDHDDDPQSKRQKKGNRSIVDPPSAVDKPASEPRVVVQTLSEEDIVNDGYRWRKYGQKMVKGNPNPRSYYRCSSPGCPVKKHVERASHDPKVVITSYEGEHYHDMPPSRTVTHNIPGLDICTSIVPTGQLDSSKTTCNTPDASAKPKEQLNGESRTKVKGDNGKGSVVDKGSDKVSPSSTPLGESRTKVKGDNGKASVVDKGSDKVSPSPTPLGELESKDDKPCALEESDAAAHDSDATTSSILEGRTNDQHTGESKDASEENGCGTNVRSVATTQSDSKPTQQHISDSEPVQA